jgi:hypothetical protein
MEFKQFQETEMEYKVKRGNGVHVSSSWSKYNGSSILIATVFESVRRNPGVVHGDITLVVPRMTRPNVDI